MLKVTAHEAAGRSHQRISAFTGGSEDAFRLAVVVAAGGDQAEQRSVSAANQQPVGHMRTYAAFVSEERLRERRKVRMGRPRSRWTLGLT